MGSRTRLAVTSCAQWSVIKEQRWVCKGWCANTSCGYDCLLSNNPRNLGSFLRPALAAKLPHDAAVAISSRQSPTATATAATSRHAGACVDRESSSALRQQSSGVAAVSTNLSCPARWGVVNIARERAGPGLAQNRNTRMEQWNCHGGIRKM